MLVQNCELLPISMYFNEKKIVKVLLGVGKKKNLR
jgi:tmRNA-binding protein